MKWAGFEHPVQTFLLRPVSASVPSIRETRHPKTCLRGCPAQRSIMEARDRRGDWSLQTRRRGAGAWAPLASADLAAFFIRATSFGPKRAASFANSSSFHLFTVRVPQYTFLQKGGLCALLFCLAAPVAISARVVGRRFSMARNEGGKIFGRYAACTPRSQWREVFSNEESSSSGSRFRHRGWLFQRAATAPIRVLVHDADDGRRGGRYEHGTAASGSFTTAQHRWDVQPIDGGNADPVELAEPIGLAEPGERAERTEPAAHPGPAPRAEPAELAELAKWAEPGELAERAKRAEPERWAEPARSE